MVAALCGVQRRLDPFTFHNGHSNPAPTGLLMERHQVLGRDRGKGDGNTLRSSEAHRSKMPSLLTYSRGHRRHLGSRVLSEEQRTSGFLLPAGAGRMGMWSSPANLNPETRPRSNAAFQVDRATDPEFRRPTEGMAWSPESRVSEMARDGCLTAISQLGDPRWLVHYKMGGGLGEELTPFLAETDYSSSTVILGATRHLGILLTRCRWGEPSERWIVRHFAQQPPEELDHPTVEGPCRRSVNSEIVSPSHDMNLPSEINPDA